MPSGSESYGRLSDENLVVYKNIKSDNLTLNVQLGLLK